MRGIVLKLQVAPAEGRMNNAIKYLSTVAVVTTNNQLCVINGVRTLGIAKSSSDYYDDVDVDVDDGLQWSVDFN